MKHEPDEPPCPGDALEPYGVLHGRCSLTRRPAAASCARRAASGGCLGIRLVNALGQGRGPAIAAGAEHVCGTA